MLNEAFLNLLRASWQGSVLALLVCGILLLFGKRVSAQVRFLLVAIVLVRFLLPMTPPGSLSLFGWMPATNNSTNTQRVSDSANMEPVKTLPPQTTTAIAAATMYGNVVLKTFRHYAKIVPHANSPALLGVQSQDNLLERRITMILKPTSASLLRVLFGTLLIFGIALIGLTDAQTVQKHDVTETKAAQVSEDDIQVRFQFVDETGQPVPEVEFHFSFGAGGHEEEAIIADSEGRVTLFCSKDQYRSFQFVAFSRDAKLSAWESYDAQRWGSPDEAYTEKKFTLYKTTGRFITGTVKDANGKPVEGAYVGGCEAGSLPLYIKSNADGVFCFFYTGSKLFQVYAAKPGVGFAYHVTEELNEWEGEMPPDKISNGPFHLVLDKPQTVQVRVTDEKGNPIPGAIVTPDTIFVSTKEKPTAMKDSFFPLNPAPPVFFQKANTDGLVTFDWIPTTNLKSLFFRAKGQKEAVTMPDGTSKYFGESQYAAWNKKDPVIAMTLPQQAKVKLKFVNTDGSPALDVHPFLEWTTQSRPMSGQGVYPDENGEAEIFGNAGDIFDIHSVRKCF